MSTLKKILVAATGLGAMLICDTALAQSLFTRDRNVSVLQRPRPEYDPQGIRAGSFIIRPKLETYLGWSDNVFAIQKEDNEQFGEQDDYYFILRPSVRAESDWSRHAVVLGAYVEATRHADFDENDVFNGGAFADGRLDIKRNLAVVGGASYDVLHESRKMTNTAFLSEYPVRYDLGASYLGVEHELGRIRYRGRLNYKSFDYDDAESFLTGAPIDQDYRDREEYSVLLQGGFAVTRDASAFLRGTYRRREYDMLAPGLLDRDSDGYKLETGIDFDITRLMRGSVAIGYMQEEFDDPAFDTIDGVSLDGGIEWFPSERATVRLEAGRDVLASPLADAGGYIASDALVGVDYELFRNIILSATAGYGTDDYENVDREAERYGASLGATWLINRLLSAGVTYTYENQDVSGVDADNSVFVRDYETNEILLNLTLER